MALVHESYDLVILDWMLPDTTGDQLLTWIRENVNWLYPGIVFATARDSEEDIVRGLTLGADDYIVKPVRRGELLARVQAVARRGHDVLRRRTRSCIFRPTKWIRWAAPSPTPARPWK